jgi:hypothetical protein
MFWGPGPELGILTIIGYLVFLIGVALLWRNRDSAVLWLHDELGAFLRATSRYVVVGPFYEVRRDSRLNAISTGLWRALLRMPRSRAHLGAILLFVGSLLFLLDLFI